MFEGYIGEYARALFAPLVFAFASLKRPHSIHKIVSQDKVKGRIIGLYVWAWASFFGLYGLTHGIVGERFIQFDSEEGLVFAILAPIVTFFYFFVGSFFYLGSRPSRNFQKEALGILLVASSLWILLASSYYAFNTLSNYFASIPDILSPNPPVEDNSWLVMRTLTVAFYIVLIANLFRLSASHRFLRLMFIVVWMAWPFMIQFVQ